MLAKISLLSDVKVLEGSFRKEYVQIDWPRIRKYLEELGVPTSWHENSKPTGKEGLPDFIPENIFYRLAMKAKNETAEKFQAKVADENCVHRGQPLKYLHFRF
mgnify:CR=1 FL=1